MNDRIPSASGTDSLYAGGSGSDSGSVGDDDADRFFDDSLASVFCGKDLEDYFCLGLLVNWPPTSTVVSSQAYNATNYENFLAAVKTECFRGRDDFLFCLPFHALHITVATLIPATKISQLSSRYAEQVTGSRLNRNVSNTKQKRLALAEERKQILLRASSHNDWPKRPLELELESAEIGNRAGIFLWKEHTGGIAKIRQCLEAAAKESFSTVVSEHLRIPDIIHTSFLRYHHCEVLKESPKPIGGDNDGALLRPSQAQSILIKNVLPNQALFSKTCNAEVDDVTDIRRPCGTGMNSSTGTKLERLFVDVVSLVDCKVYLLDPRMEECHEIFLSLPLKE
eukprot:CAMPEP_0197181376 /NCGR_PEP_ID=MMETSP1423-20130617/5688_1 /TAXON_ID=476441 /ORGANISM="Pseudo-nitzschia heimii, Strain UNC1101" /LENGTH=338 /DNA_ID=CAMNT_0042631617 /DNA_START=67 /DNA_END=1083 /DNA_ORIENTATION=+